MNNKAMVDLSASKKIMQSNIKLFHEGHRDSYRVIAGELRKLLCDGKNSLIPRLFPKAALHPLRGVNLKGSLMEGLVFRMPSRVHFDGKGSPKILELFDPRKKTISIEEWLDQPLFNKDITIRELIRSVADKENAHSDPHYNDTLKFTKSVKLGDEAIHEQHIVAIGEYILEMGIFILVKQPS